MLCTQVLNGLSSALGVLSLEPGQGLRDRHRQLRSARDAGAGGREEGGLPRALQAAGRRRRLALPDRRPAVDRPADEGRRLPLRLGRGHEAVRAPDRRHRADAGRPAWRAISSASSTARAICGSALVEASAGQGRHAGRRAAALLLSLRPDDRPLRPRRSCARSALAGAATVLALGAFIVVMVRRENASDSHAAPRTSPWSARLADVVRLPALSRSRRRRWPAAWTRCTSSCSASRRSSRC